MAEKTTVYAMGTGIIYTAPYVSNPLDGIWTPSMVSLKGTLVIAQEEGETKEVYIDQKDAPVVVTHSSGKVTVTFSAPNTAKAQWEKLYNTATVDAPVTVTPMATALGAMDKVGVKLVHKPVSDMFMVEMKEGGQKYIFPFVDWLTSFAKDDDDNPTMFKVTLTVKANEATDSYDFIVLNPVEA